ncbi:hypothetical protein N9195_00595 [bacterium]|nr:hypothetical protein [bacterium]
MKMRAPFAIQEALEPLLEEGLFPGVSVWRASFSPFTKTSECEAFRLNGWEETKIQIATTEDIKFETTVPGCRYEEDGVIYDEPETIEEHSFRFLTLKPLDSRDLNIAAVHEVAIGSMEGFDLLYANYEIPFPAGKEIRRVVGGLRV